MKSKRTGLKASVVLTAIAALGASANAADQAKSQSASKSSSQQSSSKMTQEMTLNELHHINQKEIQMAKMAQKKAQSPELKSSAQQMLDDHEQLDKQVMQVAKSENIRLQGYSPATHEKAVMARLNGLSGSEFDRQFAMSEDRSHHEAMQHLESARGEVQDAETKRLIDAAMPKLQQHMKMSHSVSKAAGGEIKSDEEKASS